MDRRTFLGNSLAAAGGAVLAPKVEASASTAAAPSSLPQVHGAVSATEIESARFPDAETDSTPLRPFAELTPAACGL